MLGLSLLILLSQCVIGLLIYKYLPSYFNEKGKNLATKEDIADITKIVEKTRSEFINETERLKASLQIQAKTHQSLIDEERQALMSYYEKYYFWLQSIMDSSFGGADPSKSDQILAYLAKIQAAYNHVHLGEARMDLFVDNEELINARNNVKMEVLAKLYPSALICIFALVQINQEIERLSFMNNNKMLDDEAFLKKHQEMLDKRFNCMKDFNLELVQNFIAIAASNKVFQIKSKAFLYKLIQENRGHNEPVHIDSQKSGE
jgi:hypothetical protein